MNTKILLTGNTSFALFNFRESLIIELIANGYEVHVLAPTDNYTNRLRSLNVIFHNLNLDRHSISPYSELKALLYLCWYK